MALIILVSVIAGFVLAATAAGRRTDRAFPEFVQRHGFDADVYAAQPVPRVQQFPGVVASAQVIDALAGQPSCACTHPIRPADLSVEFVASRGESAMRLLAGHLPNPSAPDQVLASFTLQQQNGIGIGSVIRVPFFAASQLEAADNATGVSPKPHGPTVALHVVGIEASEIDFPAGSIPLDELVVTPAFRTAIMTHTANSIGYAIRLRNGAAGLPRFEAEVNSLAAPAGVANEDGPVRSIEGSIHGQALGWWILAALAALVGFVVLYQAFVRQSTEESSVFPTLRALGADRSQLILLGAVRTLGVALIGSLGAIGIAFALSPLAPVGEARVAEESTGPMFDLAVLSVGALTTTTIIFLLGVWPAVRSTRLTHDTGVPPRPAAIAKAVSALGGPPSVLIGVRNALEHRQDGAPVPVASALLGTVLAVIALTGAAVFGASLTRLTATPALYGDVFQLDFGPGGPDPALLHSLQRDSRIAGITEGVTSDVKINNMTVPSVAGKAIQGPLLLSTVAGHVPMGKEIGLGATTMRQLGVHIGSRVHVVISSPLGAKRDALFRVASEVSLPVLGGGVSLGHGAVFSLHDFMQVACPPGLRQAKCSSLLIGSGSYGLLASVVHGSRGDAAVTHFLDAYQSIASPAIAPTALLNFGQAVNFPLLFGGIVAAFGAAALIHLLFVSVSCRRREVGLLKVMGFVNRQVIATIVWQAMTVAVIGVVFGIPLGIAVGRTVWLTFASRLGVVPNAVVPPLLLAAIGSGVVVSAVLLAVVPAIGARRTAPSQLLRTL